MTEDTRIRRGGCACGAVAFEIAGPLRPIIACHCRQCRKFTGHHAAATQGLLRNLRFGREEGLRWFDSSDSARRGFCGSCGSTLFWQPKTGGRISIFAGALDDLDGLEMAGHLFPSEAAPYYRIADGLPELDRASADALAPPDPDGA